MELSSSINLFFYGVAYLIGAIPFGLILAKKFAQVDIKSAGSKSIGATNVLRVVKKTDPVLAKKLGLATVVLDALKGTIVLIIAMIYGASNETLWGMAVLSILGHCYSVYLNFEGGKGVATGLGVFLVLIPIPTIIGAITWGICAKVLKISSLSSLIGLASVIISAKLLNDGLDISSNVPMYLIGFIIFYKHIPNLIRLIQGKESKVV